MIRAHLRYLYSPDLEDLDQNSPPDPECFGILVQAFIGPHNGPGEESFDFMVCTLRWLATQVHDGEYLLGRHYLFLTRYDYAVLKRAIVHVCDLAEGETWQEVAERLARYGQWEFEDYKE